MSNNIEQSFFLAGNAPSLKNGKIKTKWGLIPSKSVRKYYKERENQYNSDELKKWFEESIKGLKFPIHLHMYFIRDSRRKFDYVNASQIILDLLVKHKFLSDDNADVVIPVFDGYHVDRPNAGVYIWIEQ